MTIACNHSFKSNQRTLRKGITRGNCIHCNQKLVNWDEQFNLGSSWRDYITLKNNLYMESSRTQYWKYTPTNEDQIFFKSRNKEQIIEAIKKRVNKSIRRRRSEIYRDGTQTPKQGNILYIAQHALGLCCRRCLYEWYDIELETELSDADIERLALYIYYYLEDKINVSI